MLLIIIYCRCSLCLAKVLLGSSCSAFGYSLRPRIFSIVWFCCRTSFGRNFRKLWELWTILSCCCMYFSVVMVYSFVFPVVQCPFHRLRVLLPKSCWRCRSCVLVSLDCFTNCALFYLFWLIVISFYRSTLRVFGFRPQFFCSHHVIFKCWYEVSSALFCVNFRVVLRWPTECTVL